MITTEIYKTRNNSYTIILAIHETYRTDDFYYSVTVKNRKCNAVIDRIEIADLFPIAMECYKVKCEQYDCPCLK